MPFPSHRNRFGDRHVTAVQTESCPGFCWNSEDRITLTLHVGSSQDPVCLAFQLRRNTSSPSKVVPHGVF